MPRIPLTAQNPVNNCEELPFLKEYAANKPHDYDFGSGTHIVSKVFANEKGLLCLTGEFKIFLFANSKMSKQLLEALNTWSKGNKPLGYLYILPLNRKGAMEIGINTDHIPERWEKEESVNMYNEPRQTYVCYMNKESLEAAGFKAIKIKDNPFLDPTPSSPTEGYDGISPHPKKATKTSSKPPGSP